MFAEYSEESRSWKKVNNLKKETILTIVVCVLVVVSAIGIPLGYFVGQGEREVVASNCGDVVCPELPAIPECPQCPDCPECPNVNGTVPQINITITNPPDYGEDCTEYPTNYLIFIDDSNRTGNTTQLAFHIWFYNNGLQMFERSPNFDNWTYAIEWVKDQGIDTFTGCQQLFLFVWLLEWAYVMETGKNIGSP